MAWQLSESAKATVARLVERLKSGDISQLIRPILIEVGNIPAGKWSLRNRMLVFATTGELDCRGIKQWRSVGRWIRKGHTAAKYAAYIWKPYTWPKKDTAGKVVTRLNSEGELEEIQNMDWRLVGPVWPASSTQGKAIEEYPAEAQEPPPLTEVAEQLGIEVTFGPAIGVNGWANALRERIHLATFDWHTWFHELAHVVHTKLGYVKTKGGQDPERELVADFTAAVLMSLYGGRDDSGRTWEYICQYNPTDPINAIGRALSQIVQVIAFIEAAARGTTQLEEQDEQAT